MFNWARKLLGLKIVGPNSGCPYSVLELDVVFRRTDSRSVEQSMEEAPSRPIRVLVRPPSAPSLPHLPSIPPVDSSSSTKNGAVVVGFIGQRRHDVAHFINKLIDSHIFGSGKLDEPFPFEAEKLSPEMKRWFEGRNLSFYHDDVRGFVYLQFSIVENEVSEETVGFEPIFDDQELADLQGLLFMFSVCHIIIFIQEGYRFDLLMLRKFRVLQAAKNRLAPLIGGTRTSRPNSSSDKHSPVRGRVILNRNNAAAVTLLSGLSSHTTLFPGQCTPVLLFVFVDDFTEIQQPSGKGSSDSGVMFSRPAANSSGGLKKKLQSSLEKQIRFSIKKCRIISTSSDNNSRMSSSGSMLFTLDASKAVSLVDSFLIRIGESLEFAIGLIEQVLEGKETPDSILSRNHLQNSTDEDIVSVKEFISKQSSLLRGRGVGIFAAAAAAAASALPFAASPKMTNLPTFDIWLSSCVAMLQGILSAKCDFVSAIDDLRNAGEENLASSSADNVASAVSHLKNSVGMNSRFSALWCGKIFPVAMEVYLDNLSPCYTTSQHEDSLKKALCVLRSKAKGPALSIYEKKLKEECTSIWTSGRQLCDAVSLTGKPCIHPRHDDLSGHHSSGYAYLNACACGRSRRFLPDPFDFESANVAMFAECDEILPAVELPERRNVLESAWRLMRIGSAECYQPCKGLLQIGFCSTQKFLQKWSAGVEKVDKDLKSFTMRTPFAEVVAGSRSSSVVAVPHGDVYVGFEHECPHGHRFILDSDHLKEENASSCVGKSRNHHHRKSKQKAISSSTWSLGQANDDGPSILKRNLPVYMRCPHCRNGAISQLRRIFVVTASYPGVVLGLNPVIEFGWKKVEFRLGSPVILPAESFLCLGLPFMYGVEMEDGKWESLKPFRDQPHLTATLVKDTALQIL